MNRAGVTGASSRYLAQPCFPFVWFPASSDLDNGYTRGDDNLPGEPFRIELDREISFISRALGSSSWGAAGVQG